jgi:hypothetical protein
MGPPPSTSFYIPPRSLPMGIALQCLKRGDGDNKPRAPLKPIVLTMGPKAAMTRALSTLRPCRLIACTKDEGVDFEHQSFHGSHLKLIAER